MHERQVSASVSVDVQKKTVWYGMGKAVENGVRALGPESWRKRIIHIIDTQIIPRVNPKWQEWAKNHREEIEHVALHAGVGITVAEITLGSAFLLWGGRRFTKLLEQSRVNKKLEKRWGTYHPSSLVDAVAWVKNPPSEISFFQAQIFDKFSEKFGISTARNISDTMTTLVYSKDIITNKSSWDRIINLANGGEVAAALGLLEHIFYKGFEYAGKKYGWSDDIPKKNKMFYAQKMLLPLWLEMPQVDEIASAGVQNQKYSTNDILDAFARIRDYIRTPNYLRFAPKAIRTYLLDPASREGVVIDSLPSSLVLDAALGQYQSLSPQWLDEFQQKLAGIPEEKSLRSPAKEPYFKITYDRMRENMLRSDRLRPVKFKPPKTVSEKILRVLKGKKYPQQIREPFVGEEDTILSLKRNAKDFVYSSAKSEDDADQLSKPEKKFVEPERFFDRLQREMIQNEQVRATKRKKKAIEKARKNYGEKHPLKVS